MGIHIEELNGTNCKTYLLVSGSQAILVDPVRERIATYRKELIERRLDLTAILETHTHADHLMFSRELIDSLDAPVIMHKLSPSPLVSRHVEHGDTVSLGDSTIEVLHTPGHTPDSVCYVVDGAVLTGDTLLIGGSGRTDFPGGDAGAQYDAVTEQLFALPDDTVVWPAHDYKGNTSSTIGAEKRDNARFAGRTRDEYIEVMANLGLPFPVRIQQALQVNQSGFESHEVLFPTVADVAATEAIAAAALSERLAGDEPPLVLDVREPEEFVGDLGHIEGALLVPLDTLQRRLPKLHGYSDRPVVVVCRAGARSASACALLRQAGFAKVLNLDGGMLAWTEADLAVQH
jgi:glyoxylase-like metal-dependent hydrolase (beta-lactamase superfamily II)